VAQAKSTTTDKPAAGPRQDAVLAAPDHWLIPTSRSAPYHEAARIFYEPLPAGTADGNLGDPRRRLPSLDSAGFPRTASRLLELSNASNGMRHAVHGRRLRLHRDMPPIRKRDDTIGTYITSRV